MSDAWIAFRDFVERGPRTCRSACSSRAPPRAGMDDEIAAYEAPSPTPARKAGARAFPLMLPDRRPTCPARRPGQRVLDALRSDDRPKLVPVGRQRPRPDAGDGQALR